jgi:hypothetical protein
MTWFFYLGAEIKLTPAIAQFDETIKSVRVGGRATANAGENINSF